MEELFTKWINKEIHKNYNQFYIINPKLLLFDSFNCGKKSNEETMRYFF